MESMRNLLLLIVVVAIAGVGGYFLYTEVIDSDDDEDTTETTTDDSDSDSDDTADDVVEPAVQDDVVDLAIATSDLSTLVDAVTAADLVDTLKGDGPFTVLAPTNAAFAEIQDTVDTLLLPENQDQLVGVLQYHVISGDVMSTDLTNGMEVETLNGGMLTVVIEDGSVYFEDETGARAMVTTADVEASNGVVHIIDAVLLQ